MQNVLEYHKKNVQQRKRSTVYSRIYSALVFADFLNEKKLVRGSSPHLSFNRPVPTRQTDWIILDVTNALTVIRCISNALDGSEDDILWEDDGEDKDDSDWVKDNDSVMSDDSESNNKL